MGLETLLVYNFASGDDTYPHRGLFTVGEAGFITIDDSNGFRDAEFGDYTHTGGADVPDQNVTASSVSGINVGDTVDVRYKYSITGSDGSSGTVYFLATNETSNYGPWMVSDFPLQGNVTYRFDTFNTDGAVDYADLVVCFTSGTLITTAFGQQPIETLAEGDLVLTRDNGFQPLRWIGTRNVGIKAATAPIVFARGVLFNQRELVVSPNHRMLVRSPSSELFFGEPEVLVPAKHLLTLDGVSRICRGRVTYVHLLFDQHEIVYANGAPSESFFPGPQALGALEEQTRAEVLHLFPELDGAREDFGDTARLCLKPHEIDVLQHIC